jgi:hypothetical protein
MKVEFDTINGKFLIIKCPNNCNKVIVDDILYTSLYDDTNGETICKISNKEIKIGIVGFIKDLTEKDWSNVVDSASTPFINTKFYRNYKGGFYDSYANALASSRSLMLKLGVYLDNPKSPDPDDEYNQHVYEEYEKRVGNWLLLKYV